VIFASAMQQDYTVRPSMIGAQPQANVIWSYNDSNVVTTFDETHPVQVSANQCDNLTICLWYVSPLQSLHDSTGVQFALLGEWNKWTAVSQQRFTSIVTDAMKHEATITVQGVSGETVPVVLFHSVLLSLTVNCPIPSASGQAHLVITTSNVVCS
jgi:hypothetical protein